MGAEIDENLETAKFDTSQAVVSRMQELDLRMGVLLEKIKLFASDPSQWTLIKSSSAVANSGAAQASSSSTSPTTTSPATATSSSSSSSAEELITAARQHILYDWSKILEESKQKLLVKQPKNEQASSPQALTLTDLEKLCLASSEWKSIPRAASQYFFDAFRDSIMSEVGPLLPADFIQKNKMYPKMRSSAVQNELQENGGGGGNGNEKDSSFTVSNNNNKSKKKEVEEPKQKFVRNLSSTSFFSCCTSIDANEMYQRAVSEYNSSFISSLLKPAEKDLVILGDGNNQNQQSSSAKIGEVIIWRGNVVLEAAKQNWIPPTVVRDVAISLLQGFLLQFGNKDLEQNVSSSSSSSSLEKQFNQLIAGFNRLPAASRTSGNSTVTFLPVVPAEENNNNNNNNSQFDDLWVLFDSFLHVMATAHFHCDAIYQRHFPKNLVTASSKMSSCVKKLIWSTRKSIFAKCVNLWSTNYATSVIDNFIDEASTHSMIVITSSSSATDVDSSSHVIEDEPVQPFRPVREEVAMELNKFLDGFVERYRELVGTVVKITTATQQNHTNNNNTSGKPSSSVCCGYCCRGLFQSISKIVPEANDVVLTKSLQNRLRQKLIVAFVCTEKDREVVKALLSEVAEKIWKFTVGGDLASDEKKFEQDGATNNNNDTSVLSATNNNNNHDDDASFAEHGGGMFSPTEGRGSNNNNDKPSSSPTTTAAANKTSNSTTTASSSTRFEKIDSRYESRFPGKKSLESMAELIDNAKNRIIWHAAAEMTRITDAISEMVVQKKCPKALAVFNNTFVRQCAQAAQPHLVMQAQSLLSAKELSRISERLCDVGVNAGGPNLRGFSRQDAKIIEISRTLEQMDSLLKRFPKEALQTINPEFDNITKKDGGGVDDDDDDGDDNQNNKTDQQQDNSDDLAWNQQNNNSAVMGRNNNNMDDMQKLFAEMGKVLPLYRMKQSWNVYDQMVKNN